MSWVSAITVGSCPGHLLKEQESFMSAESDSSEVISTSDEEDRWKEVSRTSEIPSEYWNVQKLVKYIKAGNPTTTIVSLCCLRDFDLTKQINQFAIMDIGGLEVLVNLLECNDLKCRLGALYVLADVTTNIDIRRTLVDLGSIPLLVEILSEPAIDLKTMAAETIANVAKVRLARKLVRKCDGISKLVDLIDVQLEYLTTPKEKLSEEAIEQLNMAKAGAKALWSLSESRHNREVMRKYGLVPLMAKLLKSIHTDVVVPIMGTCSKCATQVKLRLYDLKVKTQSYIHSGKLSIGDYNGENDSRYYTPFSFREH